MSPTARPALDRSPSAVLEAATRLLLVNPDLSLGELASRIGIGRTTLHRMYPTRPALLAALAHDALDQLSIVYAAADLDGEDPLVAVGRLVEGAVPLGPRLMFLVRARELDDDADLDRRLTALDEPLVRSVVRAQVAGMLEDDVAPEWVVECLYGLVWVAWEQVEKGRLAPRDAAPLVMRTWLRGVVTSASRGDLA